MALRRDSRPMKASGLGWAAYIPASWDVAKVCLVARLESGHTPSRQHPEYWIPEECTIPWCSLSDVWQIRDGTQTFLGDTTEKISPVGMANSAARLLPAGTVVLSRTASVGFAGIMPRPMATTQDFANWIPGERIESEFLLYALRAMKEEFQRATMGSTHQTIYMPDIRRLAIPVPSREEQASIVRALRRRLPKIDELIGKKERLVELLAEKRHAVITQAVTTGLDPTTTMKESGVEWLGRVPSHWIVTPIKRLFARMDYGISAPLERSGRFAVLRMGNIQAGEIVLDDVGFVNALDDSGLLLAPGDLLFNRTNSLGLVGKVGLFRGYDEGPITFASYLVRMRVTPGVVPEYVNYLLNTPVVLAQARASALPSISQANLNPTRYGELPVCMPPQEDQTRILKHLSARLPMIERASAATHKTILRLREYRQALITAAVTGTLDVQQAKSETDRVLGEVANSA